MPATADLDQPLIVDRAVRARHAVETVEGQIERVGQPAQIIFLADRVGGDQHPLGADADRQRPLLRLGQQADASSSRRQSSSGQSEAPPMR